MACYFEGRDESPVVLLDPVEQYQYGEVRDSVDVYPYVKDPETELEDFNYYKLKVHVPTVSPKMVPGAIDHTVNPRDPVIVIGFVTKKEKLLHQVVIMLTKLMTKASTTLFNTLLTIKNYFLHCIMSQWVSFHLI